MAPKGDRLPIVEIANVGCVNEHIYDIAKRPIGMLDNRLEMTFDPRLVRALSAPSYVMATSTADISAIVLSGGPVLDGWLEGDIVGSGTVLRRSRRKLAAGDNRHCDDAGVSRRQPLNSRLSSGL